MKHEYKSSMNFEGKYLKINIMLLILILEDISDILSMHEQQIIHAKSTSNIENCGCKMQILAGTAENFDILLEK